MVDDDHSETRIFRHLDGGAAPASDDKPTTDRNRPTDDWDGDSQSVGRGFKPTRPTKVLIGRRVLTPLGGEPWRLLCPVDSDRGICRRQVRLGRS